jgi:hypothetical protein
VRVFGVGKGTPGVTIDNRHALELHRITPPQPHRADQPIHWR